METNKKSILERFTTLKNDSGSGGLLKPTEIRDLSFYAGLDLVGDEISLNQEDVSINPGIILAEADPQARSELNLRKQIALLDNRLLKITALCVEAVQRGERDTFEVIARDNFHEKLRQEAVDATAEYAIRFFGLEKAKWHEMVSHFFFRGPTSSLSTTADFIFPPLRFEINMHYDACEIGDDVLSLADEIKRHAEALVRGRIQGTTKVSIVADTADSIANVFSRKKRTE